jgi:CheY-like chemotaxis protein
MSQTVLIVDDANAMHELIKVHLSEQPWTFQSAFDGPSALVLAASLNPDLILLDVDMPGMNGFDVCRALKANHETARIP